MALAGNQKAYLQARSGIARSGAIRSNYVFPLYGVVTIGGVNFTKHIREGSLRVTLAINEEPDTASFDIRLTDPAVQAALVVGADVIVGLGGATDNPLFGGRILTAQTRRGPARTASVRSVMCADYLQSIDSEYLITYGWAGQSATVTILDLIARFFNRPGGVTITTSYVQTDLPTHSAFTVINERFSTVLRRLVTMFPTGGGFYVDPLKILHVWAGASEPNVVNPAPVTIDRAALKSFADTVDAAQQRDAVIVEGRRTTAPLGLVWEVPNPAPPPGVEDNVDSIPVLDASIGDPLVEPSVDREIRVGSQRLLCKYWYGVWSAPAGTPQVSEVTADVAFNPNPAVEGNTVTIPVTSLALLTGRDARGAWVVIDDQYLKIMAWVVGIPAIMVPRTGFGAMLGPIRQGAAVTNIDSIAWLRPTRRYQTEPTVWERIRNQPIDSDVVLTVRSTTGPAIHEHLVQDGRYSRTGATQRGLQELADFTQPLTTIEFESDDLNARPGRLQAYSFDPASPTPTAGSLMILSSDIYWPVWGQLPRAQCAAAKVLVANVMDTWLIDSR